jgi:hypothetical protein
VVPEEPAIGAPGKGTAVPVSDRQILVTWTKPATGADNIAYYRIYRGKDPDFPCDLRHFLASRSDLTLLDSPVLNYGGWINNYVEPGTTYYYKVCAVSRGNLQGPPSGAIRGKTMLSSEKNLPPAKIEGLHAVHVSPITSDNYLCLFFYSGIEKDITRYRIFRSKNKGFYPAASDVIGEINASTRIRHTTPHGFNTVERSLSEFTMQMFADESVEANIPYYYRVCAVDSAGQQGEFSDEASGTAILTSLIIEGNRFFFSGGTDITIKPSFTDGTEVHYTLDGSLPSRSSPRYTGPIRITKALKLRSAVFYPRSSDPEALAEASFATALYPAPKYNTTYGARWGGSGVYNLVDGQRGEFWNDGFWQGFEQDNLDVVVDLGKTTEISEVSLGAMQFLASWIFLPTGVEFFVSSDGNQYTSVGKVAGDPAHDRVEDMIRELTVRFSQQPARYIRVVATNKAICPDWHVGAGGKAWIFADEITVR